MSALSVYVLLAFPEGRNSSSENRVSVVKVNLGYRNLRVTEYTKMECGLESSNRFFLT